jgi:CheY-like chemotaxis protein
MLMSHRPIEILLVEDNPTDSELALRALSRHRPDVAVHVVRDGAEALDFLFGAGLEAEAAQPTDTQLKLILLDLKLPKVHGMEVLRRLKEDPLTHNTPVVVFTSSREDRDVEEAYRLGANSYLVKPVDFESFSTLIQNLDHYWLVLNQPCDPD